MHDTRCCGVVLRVFRSIIPDFQNVNHASKSQQSAAVDQFQIPESTASVIREYISTDVMKAAISSIHDPYFVDSQKELGALIAAILVHYCPLTPTPKNILLSLPGMKASDVDQAIDYVSRPGVHVRQQRAIVLDLLKDLKGVSISEMGKLSKGAGPGGRSGSGGRRAGRSKMAQEFMTVDTPGGHGNSGRGEQRQKTPDLEGVSGLFNEGAG